MTKTKCQREFEKWAKIHNLILDTLINDEQTYSFADTRHAWYIWQAALASQRKATGVEGESKM